MHTKLIYSLTNFSKWEVKVARARITVITYKYHMVGETLPLYEFYFSLAWVFRSGVEGKSVNFLQLTKLQVFCMY